MNFTIFNQPNKKGFSIVELLIGSGLGLVVTLGIVSYLSLARQTEDQLRDMQDFHDLVGRISMVMNDTKICTANFQGQVLSLSAPLPVPQLMALNVDDSTSTPTVLATEGLKLGSLQMKSFQLQTKRSLGNNRYIASLVFTASKNQPSQGMSEMSQSLSLFVGTDDSNKILFCYSVANVGVADLPQLFCEITGDGLLYYNVKEKKCKDRYEKVYYPGTNSQALCPTPETAGLYSGKRSCTSDVTDTNITDVSRSYTDSSTLDAKIPKAYYCMASDQYNVSCIYAADANSSTATCSAACKFDDLPSLIQSGDAAREY